MIQKRLYINEWVSGIGSVRGNEMDLHAVTQTQWMWMLSAPKTHSPRETPKEMEDLSLTKNKRKHSNS